MRHLRAAWVPAVLACFSALAGCEGEGPPTDTYQVAGRVTNVDTGGGISGATVTFLSDTLYRSSTTTDGDGIYELVVETDTPFGQIQAQKEGFVTKETTVFFDSPVRRIDLVLQPVRE